MMATSSPPRTTSSRSARARCRSTAAPSAGAESGYQLPATAACRILMYDLMIYDLMIYQYVFRSPNRRSYIVESPMFTREQVIAVATLANLELDEGEIEMFARQLGE